MMTDEFGKGYSFSEKFSKNLFFMFKQALLVFSSTKVAFFVEAAKNPLHKSVQGILLLSFCLIYIIRCGRNLFFFFQVCRQHYYG